MSERDEDRAFAEQADRLFAENLTKQYEALLQEQTRQYRELVMGQMRKPTVEEARAALEALKQGMREAEAQRKKDGK